MNKLRKRAFTPLTACDIHGVPYLVQQCWLTFYTEKTTIYTAILFTGQMVSLNMKDQWLSMVYPDPRALDTNLHGLITGMVQELIVKGTLQLKLRQDM